MNLVHIAGHLGADAEERFTASGKRVINLRVATRVRQGGKDETIWWRVNIWGDRFDKMLPYLRKGSAVIVVGELAKPEAYQSKDGQPQVSLTLNAEVIKFSPFGKSDRSQEMQPAAVAQPMAEPSVGSSTSEQDLAVFGASSSGESNGFAEDDLPF